MKDLPPKEIKNYLDAAAEPPLLLDVRELWEFQLVHLPDSLHLPLGQLAQNLDTLDPQRSLVVICHHGIRSRHAALFLERSGFKDVINLRGGIEAWARDLDPDMPVY